MLNTKRILFDNQLFRKQPYGGISKYFAELISGLHKATGFKVIPDKFFNANVNLSIKGLTKFDGLLNSGSFPGKEKLEKVFYKLEELKTLSLIEKGEFGIFHPTYYNPYFLNSLPANKKLVLTVHDMIHENYYNHHYEYMVEDAVWKAKLIPRADHIIAVSNYTKTQLLKHFPAINEDKISVVYHGIKPYEHASASTLNLPSKYILYVGIRKHYKNFLWLAQALQPYLREHGIKLLCAGAKDFDDYERYMFDKLQLNDVLQYQQIDHESDFAALYSKAICFVFPSLEEGFGIPILEAFVNSCPVVLANSSCFPEVAGDSALYFEPGDHAQLLKHVDNLINNPEVGAELCAKGKERAKLFTWENTVNGHIDVYNKLLNK